jgi:uncharacterized membrane protein
MNDRKKIEWLLGELPGLKEKAVISTESADALQQHYQSILPPKTNFQQLVTIFFGILSAALTGAGIILILAHNWDEIPRQARAGVALIPLCVAAGLGFYTLKKDKSAAWRESIAIFTALASAAAIALISQTYQMGGTLKDFLFTWMLLFFLLIYIFNSAATFVIYAFALTVWNMNRWGSWPHLPNNDFYFLTMFIALPLIWLIIQFRKEPYNRKAALLCWVITAFVPLNAIPLFVECPSLQCRLGWALLLSVLFLAGAARRAGGAGFMSNPLLPVGAVGITIYASIGTFSDFWKHNSYGENPSGNAIMGGWVIIAVLALAWIILLIKRRKVVEIIPGLLPIVLFLVCFINPQAGAIVFNLYLLAAGVSFMVSGFRERNLFIANTGMFLLSLLLLLRFADSDMGILLRGCIFIILGLMFLSVNIIASKKFKAANPQNKEAGI